MKEVDKQLQGQTEKLVSDIHKGHVAQTVH